MDTLEKIDSTPDPLGLLTQLEVQIHTLMHERDSLRKQLSLLTQRAELLALCNTLGVDPAEKTVGRIVNGTGEVMGYLEMYAGDAVSLLKARAHVATPPPVVTPPPVPSVEETHPRRPFAAMVDSLVTERMKKQLDALEEEGELVGAGKVD